MNKIKKQKEKGLKNEKSQLLVVEQLCALINDGHKYLDYNLLN